MYASRVDEKGRLKLPAPFQAYLNGIAERKLFVTSLDRRIGKIYPMPYWRENERILKGYRSNPRAAQIIAFNANDLGADAEMDSQGRVHLSQELRKELGVENSTVRVMVNNGPIEIYSESMYDAWKRAAIEGSEDALTALATAGLL
jgi:DNA-binding transcriptional regulator/RsmH inhibitor MraZ